MNMNETLDQMIRESSWTKARLATRLGFTRPQALDRRLLPESTPKVDFVAAVLHELGYDLVAVPQESKLPQGSLKIDLDFSTEFNPNMSRVEGD